ncbi:MAG: hypothetical protein ABDH28_00350 [Brevinematia bacterium]
MKYPTFIVIAFTVLLVASCGINLFSPFSAKDYPEANQYQSGNLIDQGRYAEVLSNAEKYPPQDHVVAALGIMGFDLKLITNILSQTNVSPESLLISWLDKKDKDYLIDLSWGLGRLKREDYSQSPSKTFTLLVGGSAQCMLGLLLLADIANTNAINTEDGINDQEFEALGDWLINPPSNITNLFRVVGSDKEGNSYTIGGVIAGGATSALIGILYFSMQVGNTNINLSEISNIISSLDGDGNNIVDNNEVSNFILSLISNIATNI